MKKDKREVLPWRRRRISWACWRKGSGCRRTSAWPSSGGLETDPPESERQRVKEAAEEGFKNHLWKLLFRLRDVQWFKRVTQQQSQLLYAAKNGVHTHLQLSPLLSDNSHFSCSEVQRFFCCCLSSCLWFLQHFIYRLRKMLFGLAPSPGMNPASHQAPRVFDVRCTLAQSTEMTLRIIRVRALKGVKTAHQHQQIFQHREVI